MWQNEAERSEISMLRPLLLLRGLQADPVVPGRVIRELGWDQDPPAERFRLVLKEIDGSGGLYESFEAFCGYLQKDRGLYADWQLERTESVTDDMLQIGRSLFSSGFVVVIFSLFGVLVFGGSNELSTLDLFWG